MSQIQEHHQPEMQQHQPGTSPAMTTQHKQKTSDSIPKAYFHSAAKEAGKQSVDALSNSQDVQQMEGNLQQKANQEYEDAKAKAQGLWAKLCGCLGSA